ncbi:MAG: DUF4132 domain-containing protein [Polyangiales bacterium]
MPIPWTDKEKKSLQPTRAFGAVAPSARSLKKLRKVFAATGHSRDRLVTFQKGVTTNVEPELAPLRAAALKLIEDVDLDAIKRASLEELAAAEAMFALGYGFATLTDAVVLARGVADAVTMRIHSERFGVAAEPNWTVATFLTSTPRPNRRVDPRYWLPLRHALCTASPDDYAAAKKVVTDAWEEFTVEQRAHLAYAFPDEPWGTEILSSPAAAATTRGAFAGMPNQVHAFGFLLSTCSDAEVAKAYFEQGGSYWVSTSALELAVLLPRKDAAELFMDAIPPLLIKKKYQTFHKTPPRKVFAALMKLDDERVPAFVASYVGHKVLGAQAALYFQECPEVRDVLAKGNASAQSLLASLGQIAADDTEAAAKSDVPALLRGHAWRRPKARKKSAPALALTIAASGEERVNLPAGVHPLSRGPQKLKPLAGEELEKWRKSILGGRSPVDSTYVGRNYRVHYSLPPDEAVAAWNEGRGYINDVLRFIAEHGLACVPGFTKDRRLNYLDYEGAEDWILAYECFDSPRVAPLWARVFSGRKKWRAAARRWLRADARRAADGLVPAAFGAKGRDKRDAEAALRELVTAGEHDALRAAAAAHGDKAQAAMDAFLARDPLVIDAKAPKLPAFLNTKQLPPLLVGGKHLGDEHRAAFIELLSVAEADYPGYAQLRESVDASSLESFVLALLDMWARQGGPGRHDWMLRATLTFPSKPVIRALCDHARAWARSKGAAAQRACAALAHLGAVEESDAAALHLAHIAATTRFVALRREAAEHLESIAAARGLTRDELDDRSTPDLGLDERGELSLSFGDVHLKVQPTESLGVVLRKDDEVLRSFPRIAKSAGDDEKDARKKAKARYDAFKKDLGAISKRQLQRLENSMSSGRAWPMADATRYFFEHPLAQHLARGLVWISEEGVAFRLTRDGTFADSADDEVTAAGAVRIAHVLELGQKDAEAWAGIFSDYEIIQPILQLARPTDALTKAETKSGEVKRFAGTQIKAAKVLGFLESRGWQRDSNNHVSSFSRRGRDGAVFKLRLEGSIEMDYLSSGEKVGVGMLSTQGAASAVSASEVLYDLSSLCG